MSVYFQALAGDKLIATRIFAYAHIFRAVLYCNFPRNPRVRSFKRFVGVRHGQVRLARSGSGYCHSDRRYVPARAAGYKLRMDGLSVCNLAPVGIYRCLAR